MPDGPDVYERHRISPQYSLAPVCGAQFTEFCARLDSIVDKFDDSQIDLNLVVFIRGQLRCPPASRLTPMSILGKGEGGYF